MTNDEACRAQLPALAASASDSVRDCGELFAAALEDHNDAVARFDVERMLLALRAQTEAAARAVVEPNASREDVEAAAVLLRLAANRLSDRVVPERFG